MGKAARQHNREARMQITRSPEATRFVCGHCPGFTCKLRATNNEAVKDWASHNHKCHGGNRWSNYQLRGVRDDGFQELVNS